VLLLVALGTAWAQWGGPVQPDITYSVGNNPRIIGDKLINPTQKYNGDGQRIQVSIPCGTIIPVLVTIRNATDKGGDCIVTMPPTVKEWNVQAFYGHDTRYSDVEFPYTISAESGQRIKLWPKGMYTLFLMIEAPAQPCILTSYLRAISADDPTKADYIEIEVTSVNIPYPAADLMIKRTDNNSVTGAVSIR